MRCSYFVVEIVVLHMVYTNISSWMIYSVDNEFKCLVGVELGRLWEHQGIFLVNDYMYRVLGF